MHGVPLATNGAAEHSVLPSMVVKLLKMSKPAAQPPGFRHGVKRGLVQRTNASLAWNANSLWAQPIN